MKQLSYSRSKETKNPNSAIGKAGDGMVLNTISSIKAPSEKCQQQPQDSAPQPQPKKQTRRRLHSNRPYQQRLLNMAEARREIVAALKFHRATMKQASEQQQLQQICQKEFSSSPTDGPSYDVNYRRNTRIYPLFTNTSFNYFQIAPSQSFSHPPLCSLDCTAIPQLPIFENLSFTLPSQPLGLNLNLHDFDDMEITLKNSSPLFINPFSSSSASTLTSSSSSSYSCSSFTAPAYALEVPSSLIGPIGLSEATSEPAVESHHPVMDANEIAEIRSIGEKHDMEWNDKLNLAHSAWWSKLLTTIETDAQGQEERIDGCQGDGFEWHNEVMDVTTWLSDQQQLGNCFMQEDYLQAAALPCLDHIGEIEGIYGEWLL